MESVNKQKWEDLNLSQDEVKNIGEALKKEEFRNLLVEYVKEINDPENRRQYEEEITQLEQERGVDVKFVHPCAGYVIKTSVNGKSKAFVNICSNTNIEKPSSVPDVSEGNKGLRWSLPYCLAPPREDFDKKNNLCMVYDVVFHPDTLHISKSSAAFKKLVEDTALAAVEESYKVVLDQINLKYPKMHFKGSKHATVIRKKIKDFQPVGEVPDLPNYPYPSPMEESEKLHQKSKSFHTIKKTTYKEEIKKENLDYTTPKYTLKYRKNIDVQDFTNDPLNKLSATVPSELVIVIELPLLKHSTDMSIDVAENSVFLVSERPAKYKLSLTLPYTVDDLQGNAKFDIDKKILTITVPVAKHKYGPKIDITREDSGIDSDNCIGRSNSTSSSEDDINDAEPNKIQCYEKHKECAMFDENLRRENSVGTPTQSFLKHEIHYVLPNYRCQLIGNVFNCNLQVTNVNPESVQYCFTENSTLSGCHLSFLSTGSGFFPTNYAICILFPSLCCVDKDTLSVEVWDNNVILQINVNLSDNNSPTTSFYCFIGSDESHIEKVNLSFINAVDSNFSNDKDEELNEDKKPNDEKSLVGVELGCLTILNSCQIEEKTSAVFSSNWSEIQTQDEENQESKPADEESEEKKDGEETGEAEKSDLQTSSFAQDSSAKRQALKSRTMSESHQTEVGLRKSRGILKIGRSLSESSVDDYASWNTEKEKTKKTVRFSEVISRQTFRMNSSILGQRKKNQRKLKNKKRAQERRLSESGNESEGESETALMRGREQFNSNRDEVWYQDPDTSSCETSELSEVSDVSESDDGQKEDVKSFLPCSNKRNHKRRGKKSARKNAATAKFQYVEN